MSNIEDQLLKIKHQAEEREAKRKAETTGLGYLDLNLAPIETDALQLIPEAEARRLQVAPIQLKGHDLVVAVFDPENPEAQKLLADLKIKGYLLKVTVVSLVGLERAWSFYQYVSPAKTTITSRFDIEKIHLEELLKKLTNFEAVAGEINNFDFQKSPTGWILEIILAGALANRSSDVHLEPEAEMIKVRFRVDGILHDVVSNLARSVYSQLLNRIKLLSNLKLNIQHEPQDGRFTIGLTGKEIEARVSLVPSEFGETVVMRLLDPEVIKMSLTDLGLRADDLEIINQELKQPNGMILNSGPTGSGKTTTLYAFLQAKQSPEIKIITIEDPIEYHLAGVEQTQVSAEYDFANGLRSIMRQDPDVILVGEIRDKETAEIAMQAALTGHLVFSTVHANNAAGVIPRLLDLDIKPVTIGPALNLVIAQRLVRRLCDSCKKTMTMTDDWKNKIEKVLSELPARVNKTPYQDIKVFGTAGCDQCNNTGYRGRIGVYELLKVDKQLEEFINKESGEAAMEELAKKQGMVTMQQDGLLKVLTGVTTLEEVEAVTGLILNN